MTYDEFRDVLRLLSQLQRQELINLHAFTEDDHQAWVAFKRDPLRWLLRADDHRAAAVWSAMERRGKRKGPRLVKSNEHAKHNVIQFIPRDRHDRW